MRKTYILIIKRKIDVFFSGFLLDNLRLVTRESHNPICLAIVPSLVPPAPLLPLRLPPTNVAIPGTPIERENVV